MPNWMHPWYLLALAALAVPLVAHLIGTRQARRIPFPPIEFLLRSALRRAWWERLRRLLVLATRLAFVLAFVLALARPRPPEATSAATAVGAARVLILDASWSMSAHHDGQTLADRALQLARARLGSLPADEVAALVFAGAQAVAPLGELSASRGALLAALDGYRPQPEVADMDRALQRAAELLAGAGERPLAIEILGDLARNSYATLSPLPLPRPAELIIHDAAGRADPRQPLPNLALLSVAAEPLDDGLRWRVVVELANLGPSDQTALVELTIGEAVVARGQQLVRAGQRALKPFVVSVATPGLYLGRAALGGEPVGLAEDDAQPFTLHVTRPLTVVAINGQRRGARHLDELFYLERALAQTPAGQGPLGVRTLLPAEAEEATLGDVAILANVAQIGTRLRQRLVEHVAAGGGLLITIGDQTSAEAYNRELGELLPQTLHDFQAVTDPGTGRQGSLGVGQIDWSHPLFERLDRRLAESLEAARVTRYMNVSPGAGARAVVPLRLDNGAPLLLERPVGRGRVLLLCTSIDRDFGDLAIRTGFVPLTQRLVRYLGRALQHEVARSVTRGQPLALSAPSGASGLRVTPPAGPPVEAPALPWTFTDTRAVGVYRVEVKGGDGRWEPAPEATFMARPILAESDYAPLAPAELQERVRSDQAGPGQPLAVRYAARGAADAPRPWSAWLLLAALGLLAIEMALAA